MNKDNLPNDTDYVHGKQKELLTSWIINLRYGTKLLNNDFLVTLKRCKSKH